MTLADRIDALLPQTQCEQCGYRGCRPYAEAIARAEAAINQCPPGGTAGIEKLAALLQQPVLPLNPEHGIEKSRTLVASVPLSQRVYDRLKSLDSGPNAPGFSIAAAAGPSAQQVFARASGQSLNQGIAGLYSRAFMQQALRPRSQDVLRQFTEESGWVLGAEKSTTPEKLPAALQGEIEQLYLVDYAKVWDEYLRDVRLVKLDSVARSTQVAQVLGRPDSPLPTGVLAALVRPPHRLGGAHRRGALYSSRRAPSPYCFKYASVLRGCAWGVPIALFHCNGSNAWRLPGTRCASTATGGT